MNKIEELAEFYNLVFNNILDGHMTTHDLMSRFEVSWEVANRIIELHHSYNNIS